MSDLPAKLKRLNAAARALACAENQDHILNSVLDGVQAVFGRRTAAVLLRDSSGQRLTIAASHGYEPEVVASYHASIGSGVAGTVAATGRARLVADVSQEPDYLPGVHAAVSEMAVPLTVDGEVIGVLDVESRETAFGEEDMALLESFGEQVGWALRHGRATEQAEKRTKRLALLNKAARALNSEHDPDALLARILDLAHQALGFRNVAVLVLDREGKELVVKTALRPQGVVGLRIPVDQGVTGTVFRTGVPELVRDVRTDPRYIPGGIDGGHSELVAPLRLDGETIGVLDAEAANGEEFGPLDLEVFTSFAAQVATALHNARMIQDLEDRANRLKLICRSGRALSTLFDPDELMVLILEAVSDALSLEHAAILIYYPQRGELVVHAAQGYKDAIDQHIRLGEGVTGSVALSGESVLIDDVTQDPRYRPGIENGRSEMAVPLRVYGELFGVLDAESPLVGAFSPRDLELFQAFADQAAVALNNARLFHRLNRANGRLQRNMEDMERLNRELEAYTEQISKANRSLEEQIRQLTALHQAGKTITSSLDLDQTLSAILQMSREMVASSAGAIKLMDEETKELRVAACSGRQTQPGEEHLKYDLPLRIGERTIGVFEVVREAAELGDGEKRLLETLASQAAIAIENARLFENTQRIYYDTLRSLAKALEARDDYTRGHSDRVAKLAVAIAADLGLTAEEQHLIYNSALLHDIGKIGIRDEVLLSPRRLTEAEMEIIRKHPSFGSAILGPLKFLGRVAEMVGHHHERWDGSGYPDGLRGEDIPLASRIIAVADSYDAMTSTRPYRSALSRETAMSDIIRNSGLQFDPAVVQAFQHIVKERGL